MEIVDVDVLEYRENYGHEIDYPVFRRAYIAKILAESRKDEALLRRMKAASERRVP